jgi:hypothetical protein
MPLNRSVWANLPIEALGLVPAHQCGLGMIEGVALPLSGERPRAQRVNVPRGATCRALNP